MDLGIEGQAAIVAAASRGLGKSAALALAREGANLAVCSRTAQIFTTAEEIRKETGVDVVAYQTDLTEGEQIESMVAEAHDHFKRLDILIINAGGPPPGGFLDFTPEDWSTAFNLTVMSALRLCYAVVPHMLEQGQGAIVAAQSYSVKQPIDNLILSNSLRMAVIGLVKSLANELGPKGIRVNSINPAWTWTERVQQLMTDRADRAGTSIDEQAGKVTVEVPLGRMGTVEEFGKTIAWLASPAASFIHGHALMFDGGAVKASL
jgi:3-oxoacyl-[acyl-carrier protein] reductase